jgi:hypothetical protein
MQLGSSPNEANRNDNLNPRLLKPTSSAMLEILALISTYLPDKQVSAGPRGQQPISTRRPIPLKTSKRLTLAVTDIKKNKKWHRP